MKRIAQKSGNGKRKVEDVARRLVEGGLDVKVELIQSLIPIGLLYVNEVLQSEVCALAGARYSRSATPKRHVRWGSESGYVYLGGCRVPVDAPRVRDRDAGTSGFTDSYRAFQEPRGLDAKVLARLLGGLSCRRYEEGAELVPGALGISSSSVSRKFVKESAKALEEFCGRTLEGVDIVAVFIDGKTFAGDQMVVALGVDMDGRKVPLGFTQTATENAKSCAEFLSGLVGRGLKYDEGILFVIDGSKGLRRAVKDVFGDKAVVQRCQWHKRENVVSYLNKEQQATFRRKLQNAYNKPGYKEARTAVEHVGKELKLINESALASLNEGIEETLTLHRLGLFDKLGTSFKTTNCIESLNSQAERLTGRVSNWKNSNQKQRWLATALLDIEPRLKRVKGFKYLQLLRQALKRETENKDDRTAERSAA